MIHPTGDLEGAAKVLARGGVVALTGAGISAESGIPTFRDPGGLWERFDPGRFGTWTGIAREAMVRPDHLAGFLAEARRAFGSARPNAAHRALADLERAGVLDAVITQNVDGLHQQAGSRSVVEVHGSMLRRVCLACGRREAVDREAFLEGLDRAILALRTDFIPSFQALLPPCPACGGPSRPDFVAFGEAVQDFDRAMGLAGGCRAMLVVGTSGEVYPAADLPARARAGRATVIQVVTGPTAVRADISLEGPAGEVVPALVRETLARVEPR